ncbi:MAG: response regulator [Chloroflexi bacterium]|nr:response regulator [Chloroflexota bacterium]
MTEKKKYSILVVDDNDYTLRIVQYALENAGFAVSTALSGETALSLMVKEGLPHLALVDYHMPPGMSGFEFARTIHQFSDLPVIMLTAVNEENTVIEGLKSTLKITSSNRSVRLKWWRVCSVSCPAWAILPTR